MRDEIQLSLEEKLFPGCTYRGYIISFDIPDHARAFVQQAGKGEPYKGVVGVEAMRHREVGMCLITTDGKNLTHAALIEQIRSATVGNYVRVGRCAAVGPVAITKLQKASGHRLLPSIATVTGSEGAGIPSATWDDVLNAMAALSPLSRDALMALDLRCRDAQARGRAEAAETMTMERDAVGLAFELAKYDRSDLLSRHLPFNVDQPKTALACAKHVQILEDDLATRDMKVFGDWLRIESLNTKKNMVHFRRGDSTVTILNVNRQTLEHTTGVDLIYFFDEFDSFVMIQYKKMRRDPGKGALVYRYTDESYKRELAAMQKLKGHARLNRERSDMAGFRLHNSAFHFKLCDPSDTEIAPQDLVPGLYFPLSYWEFLLNNGYGLGPNKGKVVEKSRIRYLNNTLFLHLVQDGWMGSVSRGMADLDAIVEESLAEGRSVTVARKH